MKPLQRKLFVFILLVVLVPLAFDTASAQLRFPRPSQRASLSQTIGLTELSIVYHRPQVKGRVIWGCTAPPEDLIPTGKTFPCLVPNNQVWRMGANEATTFDVSSDVMINGQKLPKGKYSIHAIPGADEWTIAFNKTWDQWGSFQYKDAEDALRIKVKPEASPMQEALIYEVEDVTENKAMVALRWEKLKVPFTVEVADPNVTSITQAQNDASSLSWQAANFILQNKMKDRYAEALNMLNGSLSIKETYNALNVKARLMAEIGNFKEAVSVGEKAVQVGKANKANTTGLETLVNQWKQKTQ